LKAARVPWRSHLSSLQAAVDANRQLQQQLRRMLDSVEQVRGYLGVGGGAGKA
jgi:hypothetical protein